mmetsp:Transcript_29523/g.44904  ORF Transcript_29523/g.44904 Transcript_29523/m.44904 type:complete len:103 (+) Transcript_29523:2504-2812(+)
MYKKRGSGLTTTKNQEPVPQANSGGGNDSLRGSQDSASQFDHYGSKESEQVPLKSKRLSGKGNGQTTSKDIHDSRQGGFLEKREKIESGGGTLKGIASGSGL